MEARLEMLRRKTTDYKERLLPIQILTPLSTQTRSRLYWETKRKRKSCISDRNGTQWKILNWWASWILMPRMLVRRKRRLSKISLRQSSSEKSLSSSWSLLPRRFWRNKMLILTTLKKLLRRPKFINESFRIIYLFTFKRYWIINLLFILTLC